MSTTLDKLIKKWVTKYIPTEFDYKEMFTFLDNDTLYGKGGDPNIEPRPDSVKNLLESHPEKLFIWQNVDGTFEKEEDSFYFYLPKSDKFVKIFNKYKAGENVNISEDNTISSTDTKYKAGENIDISEDNTISSVDTKYKAGENVNISEDNTISSVDTKYKAGQNISISADNTISASGGNLNLEDVLKNGNKANNTIELTDSSMFKTTASRGGVKVESSLFNTNIDIKYNGITYGTSSGSILLNTDSSLGDNYNQRFQAKNGTIALTDDIPHTNTGNIENIQLIDQNGGGTYTHSSSGSYSKVYDRVFFDIWARSIRTTGTPTGVFYITSDTFTKFPCAQSKTSFTISLFVNGSVNFYSIGGFFSQQGKLYFIIQDSLDASMNKYLMGNSFNNGEIVISGNYRTV
jgi:ribosomal protein L27